MVKVIIVGQGKLAQSIGETLPAQENSQSYISEILIYHKSIAPKVDENTFFIHVGSGREYSETLALARKRNALYLQGATEKSIPLPAPTDGSLRYINAPNLDILIIKFLYWLNLGKELFKNEKITIKESHQQEKQSVAGTAVKMCQMLDLDENSVQSIRDPQVQSDMGIPHIDHHAYHKIVVGDEKSNLKLETYVSGFQSYGKGLFEIIKSVSLLKKRNYEIEELVELGLI